MTANEFNESMDAKATNYVKEGYGEICLEFNEFISTWTAWFPDYPSGICVGTTAWDAREKLIKKG